MKYFTFIKFNICHTLLQPGKLHSNGASNLWDLKCWDIRSSFLKFLLHMGHWKKRVWKNITRRLKGLPFLFPSWQALLPCWTWQVLLEQARHPFRQHSWHIHYNICFCYIHRWYNLICLQINVMHQHGSIKVIKQSWWSIWLIWKDDAYLGVWESKACSSGSSSSELSISSKKAWVGKMICFSIAFFSVPFLAYSRWQQFSLCR